MINFDNVVTAHFKNKDYTVVEVLYKKPDNDKIYTGFFDITEQPNLLKKLNQIGFDEEKLVDNTIENRRAQSRAYNQNIEKKAREMMNFPYLQSKIKDLENNIVTKMQDLEVVKKTKEEEFWQEIYDQNKDPNKLFTLKLWVLSQSEFITDKSVKTKIRKSKSIFEVFSLLHNRLEKGE